MTIDGQKGQVLLVVLLITVVSLTVGLSVASRNIISLRTSQEEVSSQKALVAAEAGIEQLLKAPTPIPQGTALSGQPNTTYGATVNQVLGTAVLVNGDNVVPKDEGGDIWLVVHDASNDPDFSSPWSGNLTIYWGDTSGSCNNAALEIIVVYDPSPYKFKRYAYDPCSSRKSNNNFLSSVVSGSFTVSGKAFSYSTSTISVSSGLLIRVVPLYTSAAIGAIASIALPSQGSIIDATGESSGTTRKINVFKGYPQLPVQYLYGLFSPLPL